MPGRTGTREIRGYIDETLADQFDALAGESNKAKVLEQAISTLVNGGGRSGSTTALINRLDNLTKAVEEVRRLVVEEHHRHEQHIEETHQIYWASHRAATVLNTLWHALDSNRWLRRVLGQGAKKSRLGPEQNQVDRP